MFVEEDEELIELQEENTNVQLAEEELLAIGIVFYSHFVLLKIEWSPPPSWSPLKLNTVHGRVYLIQHYVIKFISDCHDITEMLLKVV